MKHYIYIYIILFIYIYITFLRLHQVATIVCNPKTHAVKQISAKDFFCIGAIVLQALNSPVL